MTLDDLEFELRKLPGVRAAGFDDRGDVLMVQLHLAADRTSTDDHDVPLPIAATRIATRHSDRPVAVEVVRWRDAPTLAPETNDKVTPIGPAANAGSVGQAAPLEDEFRPRLLAVLSFPDTDELEVHLVLAGRRTIGRAPASAGLISAANATIDAVHNLGVDINPTANWARPIDSPDTVVVMVEIVVPDGEAQNVLYGVSGGASTIDAAARATLDALNRQISRLLTMS